MLVRKIAVGPDYKNGAMFYVVGQPVLNGSHRIHLIRHNLPDIEVYIENDLGEVLLWKRFTNMPCSIEYNIDY